MISLPTQLLRRKLPANIIFSPLPYLLLFSRALCNRGTAAAEGGRAVIISAPFDIQRPSFVIAVMNKSCCGSKIKTTIVYVKVGWLRADDQTILSLHRRVVTHNPRVTVTHDESRTWNLHIRQVKESDQGCYMCQINTAAMKKQLGCIQVQVPPDIVDEASTSDVTVNEGDNVTLTCVAKGKPAPRIVWRREDGQKIIVPRTSSSSAKSANNKIPTVTPMASDDASVVQSDQPQHYSRSKGIKSFKSLSESMAKVTRPS